MKASQSLKKIFWKFPLPANMKRKIHSIYANKKFEREERKVKDITLIDDVLALHDYSYEILSLPTKRSDEYTIFQSHPIEGHDVTLIAYYLTQYSPDEHNDVWWGKGVTEWNNVMKAVPQFAGHYQPRLPGELGFYDLRIKENMMRQIELAKNYGVDVFSFYYYWFSGERILEKPLNMFLNDPSLDMPFMFCFANENWTRRFSGTNESVLIGMEHTEENYKVFIHEVIPYFKDSRYYRINGKVVLQIYRPGLIQNVEKVIAYWRQQVKEKLNMDLYLIACQEKNISIDWCSKGFDAENEWMMGSIKLQCKDITNEVKPIRQDFSGEVLDYEDMVRHQKYKIEKNRKKKVYPAIMPSWDNSARRDYRGTIWHGSTPLLYKQWLKELIKEVRVRKELDHPIIFINAWNEWGEGAYLEPDNRYGYAYLQATWEAKHEVEVK